MKTEGTNSLMDLPRFCRSELVQDRRSRPDGTLSEFLRTGRFRKPHARPWKLSYPRECLLDIAVDGVPHLGNHIGWLGGNLGCINTTDTSLHWLPQTYPGIRVHRGDGTVPLPPVLVDVSFLLRPRRLIDDRHDARVGVCFEA